MRLLWSLPAVLACGCAGVNYTTVPYKPIPSTRGVQPGAVLRGREAEAAKAYDANLATDAEFDGIRFYETATFLLVYSNGKGGIEWKILNLPDQTRKRIAKPYAQLATLNTTFQFKDGMLTEAKAEADTAAVPKAVISAIQSILPLLLAADNAAVDKHAVPPPQLYKLTVRRDAVELRGGAGDQPILITLK